MGNAPIFVKIDEYNEIVKIVDQINDKLETIKNSLGDLKEIKKKEDIQMQEWTAKLTIVSDKMGYVNSTLKEM